MIHCSILRLQYGDKGICSIRIVKLAGEKQQPRNYQPLSAFKCHTSHSRYLGNGSTEAGGGVPRYAKIIPTDVRQLHTMRRTDSHKVLRQQESFFRRHGTSFRWIRRRDSTAGASLRSAWTMHALGVWWGQIHTPGKIEVNNSNETDPQDETIISK